MNFKWLRLLMAVLLAAVVLGACGDDDDETAGENGGSGTEGPASEVSVKTAEYAFNFPSTTVRGGLVKLTIDNTAAKEPHEAELVRLDAGKTLADYRATFTQQGPPPSWAHAEGGHGPVDPGKTAVYTGNLPEGTYIVQCHVPAPDGKEHRDKGMITEIKVESGDNGEIPAGDVKVGAGDYSFTGFENLKAGNQTVRIDNTGKEPHHAAILALAPGKTAADLATFFAPGAAPSGPPPFTGLPGLVSTMAPGASAARTLELKSGTSYVVVCFIPAPDGQPHFAKGMVKEFKIT
jgi:uncharacterized cupredoxin-like copper-binding protein